MSRNILLARCTLTCLVVALGGVTPAIASRHAANVTPTLVSAAPPSGAVVRPAPPQIRLAFTSPLDVRRSTLSVISDAMAVVNAPAVVVGARRTTLQAALRGTLRPGPYAVVWAAATRGGPMVRRAYLFNVGPVPPPLFPDRRVALTRRADGDTVSLSVPSDRVAHQTYTITVRRAGQPLNGARVRVVGRSLDMDMGEVPSEARPAGPGRYIAVGDVVMAGDWQLTVAIQRNHTTVRTIFTYAAHY